MSEHLPAERQLAKELNVPHSTVREAVIVLKVEGRVEMRQKPGLSAIPTLPSTKVTPAAAPLTDIGPIELLHARPVVESAIDAAAALAVRDDQINALRGALDQEEDGIIEGHGS